MLNARIQRGEYAILRGPSTLASEAIQFGGFQKWLKSPIRRMMGIGTPKRKSKIERIVPPQVQSDSIHSEHTIPLFASYGRSETRAKGADQESKECPIRQVSRGFASGIRSLSSFGKDLRDALFSVGLAKPCSCGHQFS